MLLSRSSPSFQVSTDIPYFGQPEELEPRFLTPDLVTICGSCLREALPVSGSGSKKKINASLRAVDPLSGGAPLPKVDITIIGRFEVKLGTDPDIFRNVLVATGPSKEPGRNV